MRWRRDHPWFDHLLVTAATYRDRNGDHYSAAITFFTLLSIVPLLMISVAVAGFVLAGNEELLLQTQQAITHAVPGVLSSTTDAVVATVIEERSSFGVLGLFFVAYSGWSWISNLRDALTTMWGRPRPQRSVLRTILADVATLIGLGAALVVSFALTALAGALGTTLLRLVGLEDTGWAGVSLTVLSIVLAIGANWLVLLWVLTKLPRHRVPFRDGMRPAMFAAVGFEVLKQAGNIYLGLLGRSPAVAAFGALLGLLIFIYLVSRFLLVVTVWTALNPRYATAREPLPDAPARTVADEDAMAGGDLGTEGREGAPPNGNDEHAGEEHPAERDTAERDAAEDRDATENRDEDGPDSRNGPPGATGVVVAGAGASAMTLRSFLGH
ncbi:YhjD/YihY/BrkB family envelope integrity protein [Amycolatopsis antarctica]|uniref:YhjD/YihY/BrkB family envelope integrity protein n=1 Tax=Amycolatopsis antarctica TaxID=1854586 RepID=UPI0013FE1A87|nr:YhjD/YihY/BrkB family envelope integrity protein [Amycolatopsis antarctica]